MRKTVVTIRKLEDLILGPSANSAREGARMSLRGKHEATQHMILLCRQQVEEARAAARRVAAEIRSN